ncbi:hypothetical protein [Ruegeria sp. HKCCA5426]|uniref:hypothetical protein n=1 Tax=Ruegeria sp. HKCCA5426 TaxID=2682985 RepID=UPI001488514F|nr:hypothetical protein [Ruegeria sp. HKCCA5426]
MQPPPVSRTAKETGKERTTAATGIAPAIKSESVPGQLRLIAFIFLPIDIADMVNETRIYYATELQHVMPALPIAGQARRFQAEYCAN